MTETASGVLREPFTFGEGGELYGFYEKRAGTSGEQGGARTGVVICQPVGQEGIRCHRACRLLARALRDAGCGVLRFDYLGCGDSAGEEDDARLERWVTDVARAVAELRRRGPWSRLALVGLRLGGALATLAAARQRDVDRLVLWEPALDGARHLEELAEQHAALTGVPDPHECLGFRIGAALREDLTGLELAAIPPAAAERILVVEGAGEENGAPPVERLHVGGPRFWLAEPFQAVVPDRAIRSIATWVTEGVVS